MIVQANCKALPLAKDSVDLIFTDPPYLREYLPCYGWLAQEAMRVLKPGGFVLAMCGGLYLNQIFRMFDGAGLDYYWKYENEMTGDRGGQVWRNAGGNVRMPVSIRLKSILAYSKGPAVARCQTADKYGGSGADKAYHAWGQDVASARYYVDCFSAPGDLVVDPFIGGGTTAVACELIGRRWLGFDLDPAALTTTAARVSGADIHHTAPLFALEPVQ